MCSLRGAPQVIHFFIWHPHCCFKTSCVFDYLLLLIPVPWKTDCVHYSEVAVLCWATPAAGCSSSGCARSSWIFIKREINSLLSIRDSRSLSISASELFRRTLSDSVARHEAHCPLSGLRALNLSLGSYFQTVHQLRTPAGHFKPLLLYSFLFHPSCFCLFTR